MPENLVHSDQNGLSKEKTRPITADQSRTNINTHSHYKIKTIGEIEGNLNSTTKSEMDNYRQVDIGIINGKTLASSKNLQNRPNSGFSLTQSEIRLGGYMALKKLR